MKFKCYWSNDVGVVLVVIVGVPIVEVDVPSVVRVVLRGRPPVRPRNRVS